MSIILLDGYKDYIVELMESPEALSHSPPPGGRGGRGRDSRGEGGRRGRGNDRYRREGRNGERRERGGAYSPAFGP